MHSTCYSCSLQGPPPFAAVNVALINRKLYTQPRLRSAATHSQLPIRTLVEVWLLCMRMCGSFLCSTSANPSRPICLAAVCINALYKMENALGNSNAQLHTLSAFYCISRMCDFYGCRCRCLCRCCCRCRCFCRCCCCVGNAMTPRDVQV